MKDSIHSSKDGEIKQEMHADNTNRNWAYPVLLEPQILFLH